MAIGPQPYQLPFQQPYGQPAAEPRFRRAGLGCALRCEFAKIRTLRSTYWLLAAMAMVTIGLGILITAGVAHSLSSDKRSEGGAAYAAQLAQIDPVFVSLLGLILGQLLIVVFGSLAMTSEYSSGMIRATLTVLPRRSVVYAAKAAVVAAVALAAGLVTSFLAFLAGQVVLSTEQANTALSHPHVLRAVLGGALFLVVCALLAFGIGAMLRHSAGSIAVSASLLLASFIVSLFLPASWQGSLGKWFPFNAGSEVWQLRQNLPHGASTWTGFAVFCIYAAIALIGGLAFFCARDA